MTGSSSQGIKTVLHPVSDQEKAKAVYVALLGVPPRTDSFCYVGFEAAGQHIGLLPGGGPKGMTGPVASRQVPDIEAKLAEVTAAGATVKEPARTTSVAAAWWPRLPTPLATWSGCFRADE
jgi:predicted enzyme related to lactoylglutathione lyase